MPLLIQFTKSTASLLGPQKPPKTTSEDVGLKKKFPGGRMPPNPPREKHGFSHLFYHVAGGRNGQTGLLYLLWDSVVPFTVEPL